MDYSKEEILAGDALIKAICKVLPSILERGEEKNDIQVAQEYINSLD